MHQVARKCSLDCILYLSIIRVCSTISVSTSFEPEVGVLRQVKLSREFLEDERVALGSAKWMKKAHAVEPLWAKATWNSQCGVRVSVFPNPNKDPSGVCCSFEEVQGREVWAWLWHCLLPAGSCEVSLSLESVMGVGASVEATWFQSDCKVIKTPGGRPPCGPAARAVGRGPMRGRRNLSLGY